MKRFPVSLLTLALLLWASSHAYGEESVSFRNDVMAVLSRSGCNQGACHGSLNGKGGLKLSLRGENPANDLAILTREGLGRRISIRSPRASLLLQKATGTVAHEGGPRFGNDSTEYRLLLDWIRLGCPDDPPNLPKIVNLEVSPREKILINPQRTFTIKVVGTFDDGTRRDLSHLAVYETTAANIVSISPKGEVERLQDGELVILVRYLNRQVPIQVAMIPKREAFVWHEPTSTHPIDREFYAQFKALRLTPSNPASDSMFVRRAYLDAIGVLPGVAETQSFLADRSSDKRAKLIAGLVERPEFSDFWAQKWSDLLRNEVKTMDRKGVRVFHQWIRDSIEARKPLNQFAKELITARGSTYANPPANYYRGLRDSYTRAEATAQVFLGIRIQCAKCHNHPFDQWTQDDYHQFAAFFRQIDYRILENNRRDKLDKHEFDGEQIVFSNRQQELLHPRTQQPLQPKLFGNRGIEPTEDPLKTLADWVGDKDNPYFARAQANRIWFHLMGRGLVEPNDDFRATNPAINAPVLDILSRELREHDFDLRYLVRYIMNSQIYQLSSQAQATNGEDDLHFSRSMVQPLEAEQLLDAMTQTIGTSVKFVGYPTGTRAGQIAAPQLARQNEQAERFLKVFGKPERLLSCECERTEETGLLQAFQLITGDLLHELLAAKDNRLSKLLAAGKTDAEMVEQLYLAALCRYPTDQERQVLSSMIARSKDRRTGLEDVLWAILNSKEFLLRR